MRGLLDAATGDRVFALQGMSGWEVYILLFAAGSVALVRWLRPDHLANLWTAVISFKLANQMFRGQERYEWPVFVLTSNTVILIALLISDIVQQWGDAAFDHGQLFLISWISIAVALTLRAIGPSVLSGFFNAKAEQLLYDAHYLMSVQCMGLVLLPLMIVASLITEVRAAALMAVLGVVALIACFTVARGLVTAQAHLARRPGHFFLYLCALYVVPLMVGVKLFTDYILEF